MRPLALPSLRAPPTSLTPTTMRQMDARLVVRQWTMVPATRVRVEKPTKTHARPSPAKPTSLMMMEILTTDVKLDVLQWRVLHHAPHAPLLPPRVRPLALPLLLAPPTSLTPTLMRQTDARLVVRR